MVNAGEGHVQHLQVFGGIHDLFRERVIGNDDNVTVFAAGNEFGRVRGFQVMVDKRVPGGFQFGAEFADDVSRDTERLQETDFHMSSSL